MIGAAMVLGIALGRPGAWPVLLLVPVVWWLLRARDRRRARRCAGVVGPRADELAADRGQGRRRLRRALLAALLLLAAGAVLRPLGGEEGRSVEGGTLDLVVCLDVSRSMLARDLAPSRLERARREIRGLAAAVPGDRLGLVAFAGEARLAIPLTRDLDTFAALVDDAGPTSVERGGTDLGAAIDAALAALEGVSGDHEAIVLMTDGEDLEGRGRRAARRCAERGITVHCVGLGSVLGSKIAVREGGREEFLRDGGGEEVVSAMDPEGLRALAAITGGAFVDARDAPRVLPALYRQHVTRMARKTVAGDERRRRAELFQWPLLAAVVLGLVQLALSDRRPGGWW